MSSLLIVDDESGIRGLFATLLEQKGYEVFLADSGKNGIEVFKREQPHATVLDLNMPGMDGLELGIRIKQDPSLQNTALVMLTSGSQRSKTRRKPRAVMVDDVSHEATCMSACTPASVRPAPRTRTGCPSPRARAPSRMPWMVVRPRVRDGDWTAQPA